jgi:hypothetical protein
VPERSEQGSDHIGDDRAAVLAGREAGRDGVNGRGGDRVQLSFPDLVRPRVGRRTDNHMPSRECAHY